MAVAAVEGAERRGLTQDERFVVFASSTGTVFEWYDFYLYATLAPFFASLFFPSGNDTAALLSAFATYAAGFLVRPFGAIFFGRIGDLVGRKYTFLVTIMVMGISTFAVGLLPTFATVGWLAPILLVLLRLLQGLALGGEYGGAATYVAEHSNVNNRGYATSWIQTTATLGFFLSLLVIYLCRTTLDQATFASWGWRIPFLVSAFLLVFSVWIRLKLNESPVFARMKAEGKGSTSPLTNSFLRYPNNKYVLLALLGATMGQGVVWYTGQFYALFFLTGPLKLDFGSAYILIAISLLIGTPFFIVFGWLSDKIGRLKIILVGCVIAALTYFPLFAGLTHYVNPDLEAYSEKTKITVTVDPAQCHFNIFVGPWSQFGDCDKAKDFLTKAGLSFTSAEGPAGAVASLDLNGTKLEGFNAFAWSKALIDFGYPHLKVATSDIVLDKAAADALAALQADKKPIADIAKVLTTARTARRRQEDGRYVRGRQRRPGRRRFRRDGDGHRGRYGQRRSEQGQLVHGRAHTGDHGDLCHDGLWADCSLPGRVVPDQDPLHLDVLAVSHRQWLVRRHAAAAGDGDGGVCRQHLLRPLVSDHRGDGLRGDRRALPARDQGHPSRRREREIATLHRVLRETRRIQVAGFFLLRQALMKPG